MNIQQFLSKPRETLSASHSLTFNGGLIQFNGHDITITQEKLCDKICTVPTENGKIKATYIKERARGAYVASVCQPEATFGLSFAAQAINPSLDDVKSLNRVLAWQKNNAPRGLRFVAPDLKTIRLVVFTDSSFANNKDLTFQIGFIIVMADDMGKANIVHWSSIIYKRITRSVLAAELYAMVHGFDVATAIKGTIEGITTLLRDKQPVPLILCTDSRSLYDCIFKLGITNEKRLMVDLMALR
ncbi:hypothetical protein K3495_g2596 [Podosphaera aphanis]|nr:hypothetical protein K3495_g2596 [Podosphaera aphanis]